MDAGHLNSGKERRQMLLTAIGMGWPWREKKKLCMGDALDREVFQQFVEIKQHQSVILQTRNDEGADSIAMLPTYYVVLPCNT